MADLAVTIAAELRRAGVAGNAGKVGAVNASGEKQKALDVIANRALLEAFVPGEQIIAGIVSEELDRIELVDCKRSAHWILCADPLDGSSNADVGGAVGTIFGLYERTDCGCRGVAERLAEHPARPSVAGYVLYGPATTLVIATERGAHAFSLDPASHAFLRTRLEIQAPLRGRTIAANLGRAAYWDAATRRAVESFLVRGDAGASPYALRYSGALVADAHRTLLEGGIYVYPAEPTARPGGKLRLLYECAPLALVFEAAGGRASTGRERIVDIRPGDIHRRVPFALGSAEDVLAYEAALAGGSGGDGREAA
jgi:fructose-1,6-bisphosphatase I